MTDDGLQLRTSKLGGYRREDVELAIARATIVQEQLQHELEAAKSRAAEMQIEITELRARIEAIKDREQELATALGTLDEQRARAERETADQTRQILDDARRQANALAEEAREEAHSIRKEGVRQVGELQKQIEELQGLRTGLAGALRRVTQEIVDSLDRLSNAPAEGARPKAVGAPDDER